MIREVIQRGAEGSEILTQPSAKVERIDDEVREIIQDLKDSIEERKRLHDHKRGIGLSAVQIGRLVCIAVVENAEGKQWTLINPEVTAHSEKKVPIREGCISYLDVRGDVPRYTSVEVTAMDENGEEFTLVAEDPAFAMLLQHEIDHMDGVLTIDRLPNGEADLYPV